MPWFVESELIQPTLPGEYLEVLRGLDRFEQLCEELRERPLGPADERGGILHERHERLVALSQEALPPSAGEAERELQRAAELAVATGALLLLHYELTVESDLPLVDTVGSKTLQAFRTDLCADHGSREQLRRALAQAFELDPADQARIDQELAAELETLRLRHAILEALDQEFPLDGSSREELEQQVHRLFSHLYVGHPLRPGEVDVIRTGACLFFAVAWDGHRLSQPRGERTPAEEAAVEDFLRTIQHLTQSHFGHFPVFGPFRGEGIEPGLRERIAARAGASPEALAENLTSMVTVIRSQEVDQYIVHDTFGHGWQAHLLQFEEAYKQVPHHEELPALDEAFTGSDGRQHSLGDALSAACRRLAAGEPLPPEHWDETVCTILSQRVMTSMIGLVSELLADAVEHKFTVLHPEAAGDLMSSSQFKSLPTKLDLTLKDLPFFMRMALEGFRRFSDSQARQDALAAAAAEALPHEPALVAQAVESLDGRTNGLLDNLFAPRLHYEPDEDQPGRLRVNLYTRLALNLLGLHVTVLGCYQRLSGRQRAYPKQIDDFRDLLVFATAAFFDRNPSGNFWHMDEFLGLHFERCLDALLDALPAQPA